MLVVNFAVDVSEIAPILLGSFLAFRAPDFKAFGDGVSGGSAQMVRKPGALLANQGNGGLVREHQGKVGIQGGTKRVGTAQRVGDRATPLGRPWGAKGSIFHFLGIHFPLCFLINCFDNK